MHGGPEARIGWGVTPQEIFLKFLNEEYLWIITMLSVKNQKIRLQKLFTNLWNLSLISAIGRSTLD